MAEDPFKSKAELIATQYMVANLYASIFGERFGVNAMEPCRRFSETLRQHVAGWTIPGLDPALSDHLAGEIQDSIEFQLSLIEELLQDKVDACRDQQREA